MPVGKPVPSEDQEDGDARRHSPQVVAWVVLWTAFATFWLLVVGATLLAKNFYDTSSIARTASLARDEGIVLFRDAVSSTQVNAQDGMDLREGDDLMVGQGARASVAVFDGSRITLSPGSELRLTQLRRSRFHDGFSEVSLSLEKGTARIEVATPTTGQKSFLVTTPHGVARLGEGNFGIEVADEQSRVSSREGTAVVSGPRDGSELQAGQKIVLSSDGSSQPLPEGDELVANGDFSRGFAGWEMLQVEEPGRPGELARRMLATEVISDNPSVAMHITRVSPRATHNETGVSQLINKDLSDYRSLRLRADVRVDDQSLSGGGYMASEFPVIIRVKYRDATGGQIDWIHGFFYRNPEERPTPNGEMVPQGKWFSYAGELMDLQPKPVQMVSIEVLSAGHSFSGMVSNVSLVGK